MRSTTQKVARRQRRGRLDDTGPAVSPRDRAGRADAGPTVTLHVPLTFRHRRGRKVLVAPNRAGQGPSRAPRVPTHPREEMTPAVRALARAFRWRKILETGAVATVHEIAAAENINSSYVSRVLRLTLLPPEIVEAILIGDDHAGSSLDRLMQPFPIDWHNQRPAVE